MCVCGGGGGGGCQVMVYPYAACGFRKSCNKWSCYYHVVISICIASSHGTCSVVSVGGVSHLCLSGNCIHHKPIVAMSAVLGSDWV